MALLLWRNPTTLFLKHPTNKVWAAESNAAINECTKGVFQLRCIVKWRLTISEASYSVHHGHLDDKGKQVIDERVQSLVGEHPPREVGHRLHFVVDEQLWRHRNEAWTPNKKKEERKEIIIRKHKPLRSHFYRRKLEMESCGRTWEWRKITLSTVNTFTLACTYQMLTRSRTACWVRMSTSLCALRTINCRQHSSQIKGRAAMTST